MCLLASFCTHEIDSTPPATTMSFSPAIVVTGMISASKRPASRAAVAFCWLAAPYSSMRWRGMS